MSPRRSCDGVASRDGRKRRSRKLLVAEAGDFDEGIASRQHREERQKQYLIERIHDLAALAWVGQVVEMIEKDNCLEECFVVCRRVLHDLTLLTESRGSS